MNACINGHKDVVKPLQNCFWAAKSRPVLFIKILCSIPTKMIFQLNEMCSCYDSWKLGYNYYEMEEHNRWATHRMIVIEKLYVASSLSLTFVIFPRFSLQLVSLFKKCGSRHPVVRLYWNIYQHLNLKEMYEHVSVNTIGNPGKTRTKKNSDKIIDKTKSLEFIHVCKKPPRNKHEKRT